VNAGAGYWPAAGVTLVALLMLPGRRWGWVLGAVVITEIGGDALHGYALVPSSWWAAGNVVGPVAGALLLRRFAHGGRMSPIGSLARFIVLGVVIGLLVGAALGGVGTWAEYGTPYGDVLLKWWAGDGLGVLVVAPLLLCLRERPATARSRREALGALAVVAAITLLAFRNWHQQWDVVVPFLILPALMLTSVRLGIRGAAVAGFLVAELANLATALGYGPFRLAPESDLYAVTVLQVFLAVALTASMVVAVLTQQAVETTRLSDRHRRRHRAPEPAARRRVRAPRPTRRHSNQARPADVVRALPRAGARRCGSAGRCVRDRAAARARRGRTRVSRRTHPAARGCREGR